MEIFCRVQKDVSDVKPVQHPPLFSCYFSSSGQKERKKSHEIGNFSNTAH